MKVVPPYVSESIRSNAERKFFSELKNISLDHDCTAYHSLNISEHEYKRWAELDFVIIGRKGVFAFEVKGGGVSRSNGIWEFTDRYGQVHRKSEGPFQQVDSGTHALRKKIESILSPAEKNQLVMGWGVVFPDISFTIKGPEYPPQTICDYRFFSGDSSVANYLTSMMSYWRSKPGNKGRKPLGDETVAKIRKYIRRDFELVPTLGIQAGEITDNVVKLTDGQLAILEASDHEPRVACRGGAGTGKSFLALETARREALGEGRTVMYIAREPIFTASMRGYNIAEHVEFRTIDQLRESVGSGRITPVDVLVVDEGQDLLDFDTFDLLNQSLNDGLERGRWHWFMDPNNQSSAGGSLDADALEYIDSLATVRPLLKRNCRNTEQIIEHTQQCTGADIGVAQVKGIGPPVSYRRVSDPEEEGKLLEEQLREWMDQDVRPRDIAVLSGKPDRESSVHHLSTDLQKLLIRLTEGNAGSPPSNRIANSGIWEFKGQERPFVALIDLDGLGDSPSGLASLYVGMTRAHAGLWLAVSPGFEPVLRKWQEKALPRFLSSRKSNVGI